MDGIAAGKNTAGWVEQGRKQRQGSSDETAVGFMPPEQLSEAAAIAAKVHPGPTLELELRAAAHKVILR